MSAVTISRIALGVVLFISCALEYGINFAIGLFLLPVAIILFVVCLGGMDYSDPSLPPYIKDLERTRKKR